MAEMTIQQALEMAAAHHRAARLGEAEAIYRQVLAVDPNQGDALHLLGLVAYRRGEIDLALQLVGRAIAVNPQSADYVLSRGRIFLSAGRAAEGGGHGRLFE